MTTRQRLLLSLCACVLVLSSACGSTKHHRDKPMVPPMRDSLEHGAADQHLEDVRQNAAAQLECPVEQVTVVCTRRDVQGDCVAVRASGCDRTYEYLFGDN